MLALMHRPVEAGVALQRVTMKVSVTIINDPVINRLSQGAATTLNADTWPLLRLHPCSQVVCCWN